MIKQLNLDTIVRIKELNLIKELDKDLKEVNLRNELYKN